MWGETGLGLVGTFCEFNPDAQINLVKHLRETRIIHLGAGGCGRRDAGGFRATEGDPEKLPPMRRLFAAHGEKAGDLLAHVGRIVLEELDAIAHGGDQSHEIVTRARAEQAGPSLIGVPVALSTRPLSYPSSRATVSPARTCPKVTTLA